MPKAFADTAYWIALLSPRDELHERARVISRQYRPAEIVTSEMVLTEFLNAFSDYGSHLRQAAAAAVISLQRSEITVVAQTSELFAHAVQRYRDTHDKSWSLTDCSSFAIMELHRLTAALTHDRHFIQAGFEALL